MVKFVFVHVALFKQGPYEHGLVSILHLDPVKYWSHAHNSFWVDGSSWHTPLFEQLAKQAVMSWLFNVNKLFIRKMFVKSSWFGKIEVLDEVAVSEKAVLVVSDCVFEKVEFKIIFTVELVVKLLVVIGVVIGVEVVVDILLVVVVVVVVVDDSKNVN